MLHLDIQQKIGDLHLALNVTLPAQGVTAIFGRSGAGKSSLINLIAGLSQPDGGEIRLGERVLFSHSQGINLPPEKRRIGYVFQEPRLFPHYRVERNLTYGCKRSNLANFLPIVRLLGIEHLLHRFPASLSGGEKQRVAIGRALLSEPDILLMDEPLSALDLPRKNELLDYLSQLAKQIAIPILYVSHSLDEVIRLADHLLLLDQGKMVAFDRTAQVWHSTAFSPWQPENQKLSLLELPIIGEMANYQIQHLAIGTQRLSIPRHRGAKIGDNIRITLPSREISLAFVQPEKTSIRNILWGEVCEIEQYPDRYDIAVNVEGQPIWASISLWSFEALHIQLGQKIYLQIKSVAV
ncbi:molybdenum ABC transporter ATP-binding protein [Pasteurellaceae bacterium Macca]|nr:molybdenum ABC transporter ATP-binding protein [Pasteurellaceae bacterium Macca]MCK3656050.1 molybdenum ABC transporter ATP-binding protein [Pasteurellaceae bacterium Macca]